MKKVLKIGTISGIIIVAGVIAYNLIPSYFVKDAHNQEMKEFRSMMRRSGSRSTQSNNDNVSYYYNAKSNEEPDVNIQQNEGMFNNIKNEIDNIINSATSAGTSGIQTNPQQALYYAQQRQWWHMIKDYNVDKQKTLDECILGSYTFNDIIADKDEIGGFPCIIFKKDNMKAYMFFDTKYKKDIEDMDINARVPKTITGVCMALTQNSVELYSCYFGY